ncbi:MAG: aldo/keto reductase, partial [Anaerolineae bacterium]
HARTKDGLLPAIDQHHLDGARARINTCTNHRTPLTVSTSASSLVRSEGSRESAIGGTSISSTGRASCRRQRCALARALEDAKRAGKTRFVGYSGDREAARWAVESGHIDTLQTSFNLVDQGPRRELLPLAREKGMGIIAKRPIANAVWGAPSALPRETYHRRARKMSSHGEIPGAPGDPILLALGFVMAHNEVDTAIVGTSDPAHMKANIKLVETKLPLPEETIQELHRRFDALGE